jgi:hypothetical protein
MHPVADHANAVSGGMRDLPAMLELALPQRSGCDPANQRRNIN